MENPRPSLNFGKFTAINGRRAMSSASPSGPSLLSIHTPVRPVRGARVSRCASHSASGTMTSPVGGTSASVAALSSSRELSLVSCVRLISLLIECRFERLDADAVDGVDETFGFAVTRGEVAMDQPLDCPGYLLLGKGWTQHFAECGRGAGTSLTLVAANLDLIELRAVLVDTEDPDVADVMMPACIHAARNVQVDLTDVEHVVEIVEAPLNAFRDRDRARVGKRAEVTAGARDDVGD